jgi:hypothetical protein
VAFIQWPRGETVTDDTFLAYTKGLNLSPSLKHATIRPWKPATDLPDSVAEGSKVRLPAPCGPHHVFYPAVLVAEALRRTFYSFMTSFECGKAYLVRTEADGAHFKTEGEGSAVEALYEELPGEEIVIQDSEGAFICKRIDHRGLTS